MKISNSKKQLAKILHENGGWRDGANFSAQDKNASVTFFVDAPWRCGTTWKCDNFEAVDGFCVTEMSLKHWHQTILSRDEYFHLYPAPDADGWNNLGSSVARDVVAVNGRINTGTFGDGRPTIEQLAAEYRNAKNYAERKQQEADDAKADADEALRKIELAGEAIGLLVSPITAKQELVITDWRDLQVGDIIQCVGSWEKEKTDGMQLPVTALEGPNYNGDLPIRVEVPGISCPGTWGINFKFIHRP